jgi:hypothetical protein
MNKEGGITMKKNDQVPNQVLATIKSKTTESAEKSIIDFLNKVQVDFQTSFLISNVIVLSTTVLTQERELLIILTKGGN